MKIEKINESKIRVTISLKDLEERNIDLNSLTYNSPAAQELFWDMMEQAELKFGFNITDSQLCIEALSDGIEGFIVTITKLDNEDDLDSLHKYIRNKFKKADLRVKKKTKKIHSPVVIYAFKDIDHLCVACKNICNLYTEKSYLYKCKETYYLVLNKSGWTTVNPKTHEGYLNEYGTKIENSFFYEGFLNEYGTKIADGNVLELITRLF